MTNFTSKKIPVWEKNKKEKRRKKIFRYFIIAIVLLVVVNLIVKIPGIYSDLNTPFEDIQNDSYRKVGINTDLRTNIILLSYEGGRLVDLALLSREPVDKKLTSVVFDLPEYKDLNVLLNRSFRNGGEERLEKHLETVLGIPIDRYLAIESSNIRFNYDSISTVVNEIKGVGVFLKIFTKKGELNKIIRTNLTTGELVSFVFSIRDLQYEEGDNFQFTQGDVSRLRTDVTVELVQSNFFDRKILEEGSTVTIEYSAGNEIAAVNLSNFITNLGATVVTLDEVVDEIEDGKVIVASDKPRFVKRLRALYEFKIQKADKEASFSGDILIRIGKSEARALTLD